MSKATDKAGRLLWVDPNAIDMDTDDGTSDYEDYCIAVELEVEIPKRNSCDSLTDRVKYVVNSTTKSDKISFFTGTDGFLTTSFTDISAVEPIGNKETLGISSIDITYNSFFYPQVTITFIDVRGSSLMYPQEHMLEYGSQGSFFKALFCFPYPMFTLRVKGFYGKQVEYNLAVEDFKSSFNSETGNFECIVKFIGYMYGIYTDLPMSYLVAAPYVDMGENVEVGKKYWDSKAGTYRYTEGSPIDTFINIKTKLLNSESKLKSLMQNSEVVQRKQSLQQERNYLDQIESNYKFFIEYFNKINVSANVGMQNPTQLVAYNTGGHIELDDTLINAWCVLNSSISYYNETTSDTKMEYINGFSGTTKIDLKLELLDKKLPDPPKPQSKAYEKTYKEAKKTYEPTKKERDKIEKDYEDTKKNIEGKITETKKDTLIYKINQSQSNTGQGPILPENPSTPPPPSDYLYGEFKVLELESELKTATATKDAELSKTNAQKEAYEKAGEEYKKAKAAAQARERAAQKKYEEDVKKAKDEADKAKIQSNEYTDISEFLKKITDKAVLEKIKPELEGKEKVYAFVFNHADTLKNIETRRKDNDKNINAATAEINELQKQNLVEVLGFTPTLNNIFRIIFAHLDTFMETYYYVLKKIRNDNRQCKDFDISGDNSDVTSTMLPPFPLVVGKEDEEKNKVLWPKNYPGTQNIIEIDLVEGLFKGIKTIEDELRNAYAIAALNNDTQGTWDGLSIPPRGSGYSGDTTSDMSIFPANLSDFYYFKNPYLYYTIRDNISVANVYSSVGYRLSNTFNIKFKDDKDDEGRTKLIGELESVNFFKAVPQLNIERTNMAFFNTHLTSYSATDDDKTKYKNAFVAYLSNKAEGYKDVVGVETTTHGNPSIFDSDSKNRKQVPINFDDVSKIQTNKDEHYFNVRYKITEIDNTTISYFIDIYSRIKNNLYQYISEDTILKYNGTYKQLFNNIYPFSVIDFVDKQEEYRRHILRSVVFSSAEWYGKAYETLGWRGKLDVDECKSELNINYLCNYVTSSDLITALAQTRCGYGVNTAMYSLLKNDNYDTLSTLEGILHKTPLLVVASPASATSIIGSELKEPLETFMSNNGPAGAMKALLEPSVFTCHVTDPSNLWQYSLYGMPLFYAQNEVKDTEKRLLNKAYLFLEFCAPMSGDVHGKFLNNINPLPYWTVLLFAARLWRSNEETDPIVNQKEYTGCELPEKNSGFVVKKYSMLDKKGANWWREWIAHTPNIKHGTAGIASSKSDYLKQDPCDVFEVISGKNYSKEFLINEFKKWAKEKFPIYNDIMELKHNDGSLFSAVDMRNLSIVIKNYMYPKYITDKNIFKDKIVKITIEDKVEVDVTATLKNILHKTSFDTYGFVASESGVNSKLLLRTSSNNEGLTRRLFRDKLDNFVFVSDLGSPIILASEGGYKNRYDKFMTSLHELYKKNSGVTTPEITAQQQQEENKINNSVDGIIRNDDMKLSLYLTLKNLYDKWLCGNDRNKWSYDYFASDKDNKLCEFNKFHFVDSFYNDISDKMFINGNILSDLIDCIITDRIGDDSINPDGMKYQGISIYQFMSTILQKNSMLLLAVPGFSLYKSEQDVKDLFSPFPWYNKGDALTTSYVGLYSHKPSSRLDIDSGPEYQYKDDGWHIASPSGKLKKTNADVPDLYLTDGGYVIPSFNVTYGKQDQSYFKRITVNMDNPQETEFSIASTLNIANKYASNQKVNTYIGQDVYQVYSDHSYTCTVEMMGNAMISPMMYFQLNNIPLFRGTYMIIKVSHRISQGNMITTFTGVRMSKYKMPYVTSTIETSLGNGNGGTPTGSAGGDGSYVFTEGTPEEVRNNIQKMLDAARSAIGYEEDPKGSNKVPKPEDLPINSSEMQWCAIFCSWCAERAGLSPDITTGSVIGGYKGKGWTNKYTARADGPYKYLDQMGRVIHMSETNKTNNPPQSGDFIFMKVKDATKVAAGYTNQHIGIVESYNESTGKITVIHGNSSDKVKKQDINYNTNPSAGQWWAYARPLYGGKVEKLADVNRLESGGGTSTPMAALGSDGDIILKTLADKIACIKAMIMVESKNKHSAEGDKDLKDHAYGILQIRKICVQDYNQKINGCRANMCGILVPNASNTLTPKSLTRNEHIYMLLCLCDYYNAIRYGKNLSSTYLKSESASKSADSIPWSMLQCVRTWNGKGANPNMSSSYCTSLKKWYEKICKSSNNFSAGDSPVGWSVETAVRNYYASNYVK